MADVDAQQQAEFDAYAADYDAALNQGLAVSGEGKEFFAQGRIAWTKRCLEARGAKATRVLDYGCGTGWTAPFLLRGLGAERVHGADVSAASIERANLDEKTEHTSFSLEDQIPAGQFDLAYTNGVFHHIPLDQRAQALNHVYDALEPGGHFAFWENNPWNPGTRLVMWRIPFDRDAIMIWPMTARRLLREAGFEILQTRTLFFFPSSLAFMRPLERLFRWTPLGAQYQVLARKPT